MARFLPLLLMCLLLCGCAPQAPILSPPPAASSQLPPEQSRPAGSSTQSRAGGALKLYPLDLSQTAGIRVMGNTPVIFSGNDKTTLTLLSGRDLLPDASLQLDFLLAPDDPSLVLGEDFLSCYDPVRRMTLVLDTSLREVTRIPAPEGLQGVPILSRDQTTLYYCTSTALQARQLDTGLSRRIKEMSLPGQTLTGLALDGAVLQCRASDGGGSRTLLLSSDIGRTLCQRPGEWMLSGSGDRYSLSLPAGPGQLLLCGSVEDGPQLFLPADPAASCFFSAWQPGAVTLAAGPESGFTLDYYDLSTGRRQASLSLAGSLVPFAVADAANGMIYILARDPQSGSATLCRWDIRSASAPALQDSSLYLFPYEEAPDEAALARCQSRASALGRKYGIQILIGDAAVRTQPWDFTLEPEYQSAIIDRELTLLEQRLAQFPAHILPDTASHFTTFRLCLVRSLTGTPESGSLEQATGVQFLSGSDAYVVIAAGRYSGQALYHELFHAMETHILSGSGALDQWESLNPQPITYSYHPLSGSADTPDSWLAGENRAFIDAYSTTFPREDRARIMEYAMLPGQRDTFRPWILQRKLTALCKGIREAYGLEKSPEVYLWEQYLDAPLAYGK